MYAWGYKYNNMVLTPNDTIHEKRKGEKKEKENKDMVRPNDSQNDRVQIIRPLSTSLMMLS
jgi:hypothetical protein